MSVAGQPADTETLTVREVYELTATLAEAVKLLAADRTADKPLTCAFGQVAAAVDRLCGQPEQA